MNQPLDREAPLEPDAVNLGDQAAPRIGLPLAHGDHEKLREQLPEAITVVGLQELASADGKMATVSQTSPANDP